MQHSPCNYALINYIPFDMLIFTVPKNKQLILLMYTNILRKNDTKRENEDIKNNHLVEWPVVKNKLMI